jgi:hypothetical protein
MVKFSSLEADHSCGLPCPSGAIQAGGVFVSEQGEGDMRADACDAACAMEHKISGPPEPIVEFLYICIIEARRGCA